jgi:hypothetical protein
LTVQERLEKLSEEERQLAEKLIQTRRAIVQENPLTGFHACERFCGAPECPKPSERNPLGGRPKQHEFMADPNEVIATNAGNRFGKTTAMVVWAIIQHTPEELLPERLAVFKRPRAKRVQEEPVRGRYLCPTEQLLNDTILPTFKMWMPKSLLLGGSWEKAYRAQHNEIFFQDGGKLVFFTYKQDPNALAGASLDYVLWDEPPPIEHWRESGRVRTLDRSGCHRFGMTPVNMVGGGIGWIKREIWDRAKPDNPDFDPDIKVHRGSIWDNPDLDPEAIEKVLKSYPNDERQAREFGDFIHFGGMVYPNGFHGIKRDPLTPDQLKGNDIVVGIDPGVRNAAFVWVSFDRENIAVCFDEVKLQEKTVIDYVQMIRKINSKWGVHEPMYVIDPSARNRQGVNLENIEGELQRQGIFCVRGYNPVEAGIQSVRRRVHEGGFFVTNNCKGLIDEADEYRMEDEEEFKVVKENDHRLDALRYALMSRPWYVDRTALLREQRWEPGKAPPYEWFNQPQSVEGPPMGSLS